MPRGGGSAVVGSNLANHAVGIDMEDIRTQNHRAGRQEMQFLPLEHCKKVFAQRDFSQGLIVKFTTRLPEELNGFVSQDVFETTVNELNRLYAEAEKVGARSAMETLVGCFTCYLSHLCMRNQYDIVLKRIAGYLRQQNETVYIPLGLFLTDPIERGLRVLEVSILTEPAVQTRQGPIQPVQTGLLPAQLAGPPPDPP